MKITKSYLKQVIKEEMQKMSKADEGDLESSANIFKDILIRQGPSGFKGDGADAYHNFTWWIDLVRDEKKKDQLMRELKQAINSSNVIARPLKADVVNKIIMIVDNISETIMSDPNIFQQQVQKK